MLGALGKETKNNGSRPGTFLTALRDAKAPTRRIPSRPEGQEGGRVRVARETCDEHEWSRAYEWRSASTQRYWFKPRLTSNLTTARGGSLHGR